MFKLELLLTSFFATISMVLGLLSISINTAGLKYFQDHILTLSTNKLKINVVVFYGLLCVILMATGNIWNLIHFILHNDILAWSSVVLLMPIFLTQLFGFVVTPLVCTAVLKSELEMCLQEKLTRKDIFCVMELIGKANKTLAVLLLPQFSTLQFFSVVCVYLSITDLQQAQNIFLLVNMLIFVYKVLTDLEECYDLICDISRYDSII